MIVLKGRQMLVQTQERYIGTTYDNNSENRTFLIDRVTVNGADLSALSFRLDLEYENGGKDTALLTKEIQEEYIVLTWEIESGVLQVPGTVFANIRGTDYQGTVKWASFKAAFYVEDTINTPGTYTGGLSEMEQMELRIDRKIENLDAGEEERIRNEQGRQENENNRIQAEKERDKKVNNVIETFDGAIQSAKDAAKLAESWAVGGTGTRSGEDGNNSKYYSEQSSSQADRAEEAAERAAAYASIVPPAFHIDFDTMELIQDTQAQGISFTMDEDKILSFTYTV